MPHGNVNLMAGSSIVDKLIRNPVIVSLLMTVITLVIFYSVMQHAIKNSCIKNKIKLGFWLFISIMTMTSIHYYSITKYFESTTETKGLQNAIDIMSNNSNITDIDIGNRTTGSAESSTPITQSMTPDTAGGAETDTSSFVLQSEQIHTSSR
jgi:hypothetical protein